MANLKLMYEKIQPYVELVTQNRNYRRLWLSQIVSNFGDWFGLLAVYALITKYSDSEFFLLLRDILPIVSTAGVL